MNHSELTRIWKFLLDNSVEVASHDPATIEQLKDMIDVFWGATTETGRQAFRNEHPLSVIVTAEDIVKGSK